MNCDGRDSVKFILFSVNYYKYIPIPIIKIFVVILINHHFQLKRINDTIIKYFHYKFVITQRDNYIHAEIITNILTDFKKGERSEFECIFCIIITLSENTIIVKVKR